MGFKLMYDMNLIILLEIASAVLGIIIVVSFCVVFTVLGLSGRLHFKKKKKTKGHQGW
tara:strand:+ start:145 stop:318 length:174 start_codon:yes stop_codon:yes gene_type:complete